MPNRVKPSGTDREPFHAPVRLTAGGIGQQLHVRIAALAGDQELRRSLDALHQVPLPIELEHVGAVLVGDVEVAIRADPDAFRIEPERALWVVRIECTGSAHERLPELILQEPGVEQHGRDLFRLRICREVEEMDAIEIWDIGQAVERAAVGRRDEDVVVSGVGECRAETTQYRLGHAIGRSPGLADVAGQAGPVDCVAGDVADTHQFYAWRGGGEQGRCREKQGGSQGPAYAASHSITAPLSESTVKSLCWRPWEPCD